VQKLTFFVRIFDKIPVKYVSPVVSIAQLNIYLSATELLKSLLRQRNAASSGGLYTSGGIARTPKIRARVPARCTVSGSAAPRRAIRRF
jgi:hypothetical protein